MIDQMKQMPVYDPSGKALGTEQEVQSRGRGSRLGPQCVWQVEGAYGVEGPTGSSGPPGGRELPEAGRSQGLLHRCGHGLPEVPERVVQFALDKLGEGRGLESGTLA